MLAVIMIGLFVSLVAIAILAGIAFVSVALFPDPVLASKRCRRPRNSEDAVVCRKKVIVFEDPSLTDFVVCSA